MVAFLARSSRDDAFLKRAPQPSADGCPECECASPQRQLLAALPGRRCRAHSVPTDTWLLDALRCERSTASLWEHVCSIRAALRNALAGLAPRISMNRGTRGELSRDSGDRRSV